MRKVLLLLGFLAATTTLTFAQCTPSPIFTNIGIPGLWPNPAQGSLPDGEINVPYNQTITVIVVEDTTVDLSAIVGFPVPPVQVSVNYQTISAVNGFPTGLSYVCDTSSCVWPGGDAGCIKFSGTPTQAGNFVLEVVTSININVPAAVPVIGGSAIDLPIPGGTSYDLYVDNPNSIDEIDANRFGVAQNVPNPFNGISEIQFNTPVSQEISVEVFDVTGTRILMDNMRSQSGANTYTLDASAWTPGVYFYSLSNGEEKITKKLVVMQ